LRVQGSEDPYLRSLYAMALSYAGRHDEAIKIIEAALVRQNSANDAYSGAYNENLAARVYLRAGKTDKALDILEHLLKIPYHLSPGWLRIDPTWKALRGNTRFERLIASQ
jgi:tetratricopeptide (TPR) repeat protein